MKDIYSASNSIYMDKVGTWHSEDSPWKAHQINELILKNKLDPLKIAEVGCGVGEVLLNLHRMNDKSGIEFQGFDIAIDAIDIAKNKETEGVTFSCSDFRDKDGQNFDLLLMIDVFEHVPDYIGFIEGCSEKSKYVIFHIPLDVHVSSVIRGTLNNARENVGHLHYFTKETALATIKDAGLRVVDFDYTKASEQSNMLRSKIANIPRKLLYPLFPNFTARLLGGYSLLVLAIKD